ncbi:MAG: hypothetical protein ABSF95_11970 [Verrucomicrobiota bacterium]|jgi:predicted NodU family carbamoyl transferase
MAYVLGLNSAYHESAACLLQDGVPVAFAEEERFNRRKHGKPARYGPRFHHFNVTPLTELLAP